MKGTARVIVPFCPSLNSALVGISEQVFPDDLQEIVDNREHLYVAQVSTVEKDGRTEGTILYFPHATPHDLFPRLFKKR